MTKSSVVATADAEAPPAATAEPAPAPAPSAPNPVVAASIADVVADRIRPLASGNRLDLLRNVEMEVTAELGSTRMTVRELLSLTPGNIVELNRAAGSPIDLLVNGTLIARGEVVVVDEEFGIRISEIVNPGPGEQA